MGKLFTLTDDIRQIASDADLQESDGQVYHSGMNLKSYAKAAQGVSGVYAIRCRENGRIYIGSSLDIGVRFRRGHRCLLRNGRHPNKALQADFTAFGEAAFEAMTLEEVASPEHLLDRERAHTDRLAPEYNRVIPFSDAPYTRISREVFDGFVRKETGDGCWVWTGTQNCGYGRIGAMRKSLLAHRVSYYLTHGVLPKGVLRHICGNKLCVNPGHLVEGTYADNSADYRSANPDAFQTSPEQARYIRELWLSGHSNAAIRTKCEEVYGKQWSLGYIESIVRNKVLRDPDYRPPARRKKLTDAHKEWVRNRRAEGGEMYHVIAQAFEAEFGFSVHKDTVLRICVQGY